MKINELKDLLHDKRVVEEINRHLWIESQKAGVSIGLERATEEWLRVYALGWMKYNMPQEHERWMHKTAGSDKNRRKTANSGKK